MLDQTFTVKNFRALLKKKDFIKFKLVKRKNKYVTRISQVAKDVNAGTNFDSPFKKMIRNGKVVCSVGSLQNTLVLRKLNDNIKRLYKVKQSDRTNTVKHVACVLEDMVPMWVTKMDIKDFYESVDREVMLKKLCSDSLLSYHSKKILKSLFERPEIVAKSGLPRGLSISSTLSELYLRDLDKKIAAMEGVYYYSRYVDDIIIFSYHDSKIIRNSISAYLQNDLGVLLNEEKTKALKIKCRCNELCKCDSAGKCKLICKCTSTDICFDYLGYSFKVKSVKEIRKPVVPIISLSQGKVKKLKTRLILSFRDFIRHNDFELLKKRIMFLTGNCYVDPMDKDKKLKTGIFYNYQLLNTFEELHELDSFFQKTLFSKKGSLGNKLSIHLSKLDKDKLKKYRFYSGHKNKILYAFTSSDLSQIRECWQV